jgi:molybdate transport system ATP-binding protein
MLAINIQKTLGAFQLNAEFAMRRPGVVALFGPSGCGKSTLIQILAGLAAPEAGYVQLNGEYLFDADKGLNVPAEARGIGCVFQDSRLFPHFSTRGNLEYGAKRSSRRAFIGFDDVVELLELAHLLNRRPNTLSGGEKQRVAIGRALLSQPRLLLLDEPLASLDQDRRSEVLPYLEALRDRLAIPMVYVSHQFDEVLRLATEVVLMRDGGITAHGELAQLSLGAELRGMLGTDLVGAVIAGVLLSTDPDSGLSRIKIGSGELAVQATGIPAGRTVRVQLLARDIIVATQAPAHLSVRNSVEGTVRLISAEQPGSDLVTIDIGCGESLLARITSAATRELQLRAGMRVWALVKAVSVQGHSFAAPMPPERFTSV